MSMLQEFKEFAMKGNVMDLAVGVIIGGAFGRIVESVVGDLIMPFIAWIMGGRLDFSGMFLVLGTIPEGTARTLDALRKAQVPVFAYGNFLTILVNFVILAFIIFIMVKQVNRLRKSEAAAPPAPEPEPQPAEEVLLLREIRDSLKK
ncbi:large conductance mechanosensitive channel protein MscL [Accumulibacter sp.]|uniref:large conductance mechanosensitive channel protein MscL n=1 Tax=Accumulibacter sp. TaxID=2053492 RepID=UPI0025E225BC|nr:large conductance mechanosensitive channel protein MscL [Accumulibacter sp.]MCM8594793.1 large conductance mechanosensitive channel protein MscL [Accumulibacter sp.]MCM8625102.1 large conductance mechanosensitive channel protein MscL [Accumulibacter sp.]MDS4048938.1 large conductance mechanosensitive channel protein MscL [Accumulibacter sp.]